MFKLSESELQIGFEAIEHHGYSAFFPDPPEWIEVQTHWLELRKELSDLDLDNYAPTKPLQLFVPKSRYNLRLASLLHPIDIIIYSSIVLIVKEDIKHSRPPLSQRKVFSYRSTS